MKDNNYFLSKAKENYPELNYTVLTPDITDFNAKSDDSILLDLGEHEVGHFSFAFDEVDLPAPVPVLQLLLSRNGGSTIGTTLIR